MIKVTNIIEDHDWDGIEDAYDTDDDNDGFSDTIELAYGSNPLDANSIANKAPSEINADSNLTIIENSKIGTIVGKFSASDPDSNTTLTYSLSSGSNSPINHLFSRSKRNSHFKSHI